MVNLSIELPPESEPDPEPNRRPVNLCRSQSLPAQPTATATSSLPPPPKTSRPRLVRCWSETRDVPIEPLQSPLRRAIERVPSIRLQIEANPTPVSPSRRRLSLTIERRRVFNSSKHVRTTFSVDLSLLQLVLALALLSTASSYGLSAASSFRAFASRRTAIGEAAPRSALLTASSALGSGGGLLATPHGASFASARRHSRLTARQYHPSRHVLDSLRCAVGLGGGGGGGGGESSGSSGSSSAGMALRRSPRPLWAAPVTARRAVLTSLLQADHKLRSFELGNAAALAACACATCLSGALCEATCAILYPSAFKTMRSWHAARARAARSELAAVEERLSATLPYALEGGKATLESRVKSMRSTFEKVALRDKDELNDLLALRVILEPSTPGSGGGAGGAGSVADGATEDGAVEEYTTEAEEERCAQRCQQVQTLVQSLWPNGVIATKDYVERPKENGYQSLHLLVRLPSGWRCEVQVRTRCMHEHAVRGGAAHAAYKAGALA